MLVFLFYLNLILAMLSVGEHALAISALLSLGAIILVAVLIVRSHSSVFQSIKARTPLCLLIALI